MVCLPASSNGARRDEFDIRHEAPNNPKRAVRIIPTPPYPGTHTIGTNRMSANPRDGVVNKFGQMHDIKNRFVSAGSQFTSGAACNPTLTTVALAIRQADTMAKMMQQRAV